jgi:hypothetical protein
MTDTSRTVSGEIIARPVASTVGRGSKIPSVGDAYVVFVGTTATGQDWLAYSDDIEACPGLLSDYYDEFDRQNPEAKP